MDYKFIDGRHLPPTDDIDKIAETCDVPSDTIRDVLCAQPRPTPEEIELRGSGWLRTAYRGEHDLATVLFDGKLYHVRITGSDDRIVCQDLAHALREIDK